jgi:phosphoribosyl 1,2-cyclic phosphodiesterase
MRVTFWGARGTFPATGADFARYGGDTMCVEVECAGTRLILDAGSGLRALGAKLNAAKQGVAAQIILSHLHLDHIMGLPHFAPFWRADSRFLIHAPEESVGEDADATLFSVLRPPLFPMDRGALPAAIAFRPYRIGAGFAPAPGISVSTTALSHNGASAAIVVEAGGRKLCYATDHEHGDAEADARLAAAAEGADLLIYDATFTDAEWPAHRGWGHSTWEEGLRLKRRAGIKLLALAHHEPGRTDAALDALGEAVAARCDNAFFARQGLSLGL